MGYDNAQLLRYVNANISIIFMTKALNSIKKQPYIQVHSLNYAFESCVCAAYVFVVEQL